MSHIPSTTQFWWIYLRHRPESNSFSPPLLSGPRHQQLTLNTVITFWPVLLHSPWPLFPLHWAQHPELSFQNASEIMLLFCSKSSSNFPSHSEYMQKSSEWPVWSDCILLWSQSLPLSSWLPLLQPRGSPHCSQTLQIVGTSGSLYCCFLYMNTLPISGHGALSCLLAVSAHRSLYLKGCLRVSCINTNSRRPSLCSVFLALNFLQSAKYNRTHYIFVSFLSVVYLLCSPVLFTVIFPAPDISNEFKCWINELINDSLKLQESKGFTEWLGQYLRAKHQK